MSDDNKDGDESQKDKKLTDDPAFQQMQKTMQGIALLVQNGAQQQKQMQENFNTLMENMGNKEDDPKHIKLEDQEDAINDLDNMGLVKLVVGEVGKVVDEKLEKVSESLGATNQSINDTRLAGEVKELMGEHKDFLDWKTEMAALAKDNPNLSIARLYKLARIENPEKAEELDVKYKDESDEDKDKDTGFLGLMPTSGGFSDDSGEKNLTKEEAGDKAWDDAISQFPALAASGDE